MRLALAYYFVKRLNLDLRGGEIVPARAQLFLQNLQEFEIALSAAKQQMRELVVTRGYLQRGTAERGTIA